MKTLTKRELLRNPARLRPGEPVTITEHGRATWILTPAGPRRRKTTADIAAEMAALAPGRRGQVDSLALLKELRT